MADITFIYEKIVNDISNQLIEGKPAGGEKLPSLRILSARYGCSISAVMQAYSILEAQGKIYSIEKAGFYAATPAVAPLPAPEKDHFSLKSSEATSVSIFNRIVEASNDHTIVPLGAGIPDSSCLPLAALKNEITRTLKEDYSILTEYSDELGTEELRCEIQKRMLLRGVKTEPEDILLTNGCTEALSLAIQSCSSPGDIIALESPVFPGIIQMLKTLKRRILTIPTSPCTGMDLQKLEDAMRQEDIKAVVISALFQNPLGFVMPEEQRAAVVTLTAQYNVTLIEDDVYHDCSFRHTQERCLKSYDTDGHVLYCSSFSKTLASGIRSGWLIGGTKHRTAAGMKIAQTLGNSMLLQKSIARYLASGRFESHLFNMQKTMQQQMTEMASILVKTLPEGTGISQPQGGYYFWVELPEQYDTLELFESALQAGISIVPGPAFSPENRYKNCMRITFASPLNESVRNGIKKLGFLLNKQN